jgi:hypothetical protein
MKHIDINGLGTAVKHDSGEKLWFFFDLNNGSKEYELISYLAGFDTKSSEVNEI